MTIEDTPLLGDLRDMWRVADPPPPGLTATMIAAVAATDLDQDWELLVLVRDSADEPAAQVRGIASARVLYFTAVEGWSLDTEIDDGQVRGQLLDFTGDMGSVEVTLEMRDGPSWTTGLDEFGFFAIQADLVGSIRFVVRHTEARASSHWVQL